MNIAKNENKIKSVKDYLDKFETRTNNNLATAEEALVSHKEYLAALDAKMVRLFHLF